MRKTTKALYCAAVGLSLLTVTGGSTYALWNDTGRLSTTGDFVQTGDLRLDFADDSFCPGGQDPHCPLYQMAWDLIPAPGSNRQPIYGKRNLGQILVFPGDKLVGTTQISSSLVGSTLQANMMEPVWDFTDEGDAEVVAWLDLSVTTVSIHRVDPATGAKDLITQSPAPQPPIAPVALHSSDVFTLTISVEFATYGYPASSAVQQTAAHHMGNVHLELVQQVTSDAFGHPGN